jgi:hypothetical protein
MEMFRYAERAGVLAESLHKYVVSSATLSGRYNPQWFPACKFLVESTRNYLLDYGMISKPNEKYLHVLHLILIKYILPRIQSSEVDLSEKLNCINEIFADCTTQYVLKNWSEVGIYSDRAEFIREILSWITSQKNHEKHRPIINDIIAALNCGGEAEQ